MVKENNVSFAFNSGGCNFICLAAAGKEAWVWLGTAALDQADDFQASRLGKALEFLRAFCVIRGIKIERDEQRAFAARGTFKQGELPLKIQDSASSPACQLLARDGTMVEMACLYTI